ncbi:MAG: hypothetical protein Q4G71_02330 [Pseudomonadota bacterium]|nr:hypothetical protein [Pseudomonadota bacterium]
MKVKTSMRRLKNAQISFISLVSRGANRIPFRILKSDSGESAMLNLANILKGTPAQTKPMGYAHILKADPFHASKAPQTVPKAAPAVQSSAKPVQPSRHTSTAQQQQQQQVQEERQRQGLAPNQPLHTTPAPRRAGNIPKQPAPARDSVTLQSLKAEIDSALAAQRHREKEEDWNESRSAFSRISPTQPHHVGRGGAGNAWALRNHGGQLATAILSGEGERLPSTTAFRPFSAAGTKA